MIMDVTYFRRGPGLDERQQARLDALERSPRLTGWQAGEARFFSMHGNSAERERALRIVERAERVAPEQLERERQERAAALAVGQVYR
jgi:hypothetical protein